MMVQQMRISIAARQTKIASTCRGSSFGPVEEVCLAARVVRGDHAADVEDVND
jgi:hypothetical protein